MGVGITCPNCRNVFAFFCPECSSFETEVHERLELVQYFQNRSLFYFKCRRCQAEFAQAICPQCNTKIIPEKPFVTGDRGGVSRSRWCFIASACVDENSNALNQLCGFRDEILVKTRPGRKFIAWYYANSPRPAEIISQRAFLRVLGRYLIVYPAYFLALIIMKISSLWRTG